MAEYSYNTRGVCSRKIDFEIEDGVVKNVRFLGGCNGNLQGIGKLVEGMKVEEVIEKLEGLNCNGKGTSCPDQLAQALKTVNN
ncbi:MAG: TIGR03905 family TSCPD domain-containing protein [Clostridiales bacterium]|nr:TIGR03905 family TSCPD domain-containing protein [Clostridiales bacterium]